MAYQTGTLQAVFMHDAKASCVITMCIPGQAVAPIMQRLHQALDHTMHTLVETMPTRWPPLSKMNKRIDGGTHGTICSMGTPIRRTLSADDCLVTYPQGLD